MSNSQLIATRPGGTLAELIAAEKWAWDEEKEIREIADLLFSEHIGGPPRLVRAEPMRQLYKRANKLRIEAVHLGNRICGWVPATLADAITLLHWNKDFDERDVPINVLAGLRRIAGEDLTAAGAALTGPDEEILVKFRASVAACDASDAAAPVATDDAFDHMLNHADEIAAEIIAMPAAGAAGLAVKLYLMEWKAGARDVSGLRYCALDGFVAEEAKQLMPPIVREIIRDAVRFVPELAPLCAAVLDECGK